MSGPSIAAAPRDTALIPSKRDKRRTALSDRLTELSANFERDRDHHYLNQVHALRQDYAAIASADISGRDLRMLDDSPEGIDYVVTGGMYFGGTSGEGAAVSNIRPGGGGVGDVQPGGHYANFVQDVNGCMEERDVALAILHRQYHAKLTALKTTHERNLHHAREEHLNLAVTMKQRLINRLYNAKKKLSADKEQLDISDTHALLHHPNQFSIGSAVAGMLGSPSRDNGSRGGMMGDGGFADIFGNGGGIGSRRKLRQRKNEVDELMLSTGGLFDVFTSGRAGEINGTGESKSQRRKARAARHSRRTGGEEEEELDIYGNGVTSPSGNGGNGNAGVGAAQLASLLHKQQLGGAGEELFTKPVWGIEKLFTERELQMAGNLAALATVKYFSARKEKKANRNKEGEGSKGSGVDSEDEAAGGGGGTEGSRTPPGGEESGFLGLGLIDWTITPLAPSPAMAFGSTFTPVLGAGYHNTRSHHNQSSTTSHPSSSSSRLLLNSATHNLINNQPPPTLQQLSFMTPSGNGYGSAAWQALGVPASHFSAGSGSVINTAKAATLCAPTPQACRGEEAEGDLDLIRRGVEVEVEAEEVEEGVEEVLLEVVKRGEGWGGKGVVRGECGNGREVLGLGLVLVEEGKDMDTGEQEVRMPDDTTDSQATIVEEGVEVGVEVDVQDAEESQSLATLPVGRGQKRPASSGGREKEGRKKKARTGEGGGGSWERREKGKERTG
ncbi:Sds3-like-domain-containing protein [Tirmania nivea]|nr:Sds3-like-domain-containing protein [Tirmania nivea]